MREEREREDKLNLSELASCFSPLPFPSVRNSAVYKRGVILQTFCSTLCLSLIPVLFYCDPTNRWELSTLKLVFLFLWHSWYGYTLLLPVPLLLFAYFSPLVIEMISALYFTNPHASRYVFSYLAVRDLFSFYLVSELFFGSCVVRIQTSCFTCFLDNFAIYINKTYLAAGAVV